MFLTLAGLSYYQYYREQQALFSQLDNIAFNFGTAIVGSLKHIMINRDPAMMSAVLSEISKQPTILNTALYNSESGLIATNNPGYFVVAPDRSSTGCIECHQQADYQRLRSLVIGTPTDIDALPVQAFQSAMEPECYSCYPSSENVLGVLVVDFSLESLESQVKGGITFNLILLTPGTRATPGPAP